MERKQRLLVFDRREWLILIFLGVLVSIFAFTFGVHLGKRVGPRDIRSTLGQHESADSVRLKTVPDEIPNRQEIAEQGKQANSASEHALSETLKGEVEKSGLKMNPARPVELPETTRHEKAAPHASTASDAHASTPSQVAALTRAAPLGKFTLQIGSYTEMEEARERTDALENQGLQPFLREVEVPGKGKRYRLFLGGFEVKEDAQNLGEKYVAQGLISSFLIANLPGSGD